jgi:parvulin-like peptidyl-prolyl isomerase
VKQRALLLIACAALLAGACTKKSADSTPDFDKPRPLGGPAMPKQSAEELNTPLAKVDDVTITVGQLEDRLNRQSPYIRARYTSLEQKREFLDALVRFEVLAKEAQRRGYDKDPEVVLTMKQVMIQKLMKEEFDQKITPDTVADAEMKAYYDANQADYVKPEEVRVSAIIVKSKAQADRVAAEAAGDAGKTNKGFRDLVEKYSQDPDTKLRSGDLRYLSQSAPDPGVPKPVIDAAFNLVKIGDVSPAVDAGSGTWYVLKATGRRRAMVKSFDDAKAQIRNKLYRDKRAEAQKQFLQDLRGKAQIQVFDDALGKVKIDLSGASGDAHGQELPSMPGDPPIGSVPPSGTP